LCRGAHHHKLRVGKFDTHDPTFPLVLEVRATRAPHQDEPRIGQCRWGGWLSRAFAPRLTTTPMLPFERKASPSCIGRAIVVNGRISRFDASFKPQPQRLPVLLGGLQTESLSSEALFGRAASGLTWLFMQPLPRPSVSPLHSFASTPTVRRSPPFALTLGLVWRWLIGRRRLVPMRQQMIEARPIEALSEELDSLETWERSQDSNSVDSHSPIQVQPRPGEGGELE
jgi:hypothetical protein